VIDHHISQWDVIPKDTVTVVYRCETWLVIFREEHRLRMFENGVLREISVAEREFRKPKTTAY
jgi:transposase